MKQTQNTRGYERYFAIDTHREYHLVGGQNEDQEWVVNPRRVQYREVSRVGAEEFSRGGYCSIGDHHERVGYL